MINPFMQRPPQNKIVLAVGSDNPCTGLGLFYSSPPWDVNTAKSINVASLDDYDVVILLNPELVKTYFDVLTKNMTTPVILVDDSESRATERFASSNNLFAVVGIDDLEDAVEKAMQARDVIWSFRQLDPNAEEILREQEPPLFPGALERAIREAEQISNYQSFIGDRSLPVQKTWEQVILPGMLKYDSAEGPEESYKSGNAIALDASLFLDIQNVPGIERVFLSMGEPGEGEGPVASVQDNQGKKHTIKVFRAKRGLSAKQLAAQYAADAEAMTGTGFKMPRILKPFCFEDYDTVQRSDAFVVMDHIRGASLRQVLDVLNRAYRHKYDQRPEIHALRAAFVYKFLDDCITWQKKSPELLVDNGFMLADGSKAEDLGDYYAKRIDDFPDVFSRMTLAEFSEAEEEVYRRAIQVFRQIDCDKRFLARGRDAKYPNSVIALPWDDFNSTKLIEYFYKNTESSNQEALKLGDAVNPNSTLVKRSLYNIDPKLYRLEHVLEPLARVMTDWRSRFMLFELESNRLPGGQIRNEAAMSRANDEQEEYVKKLGIPELKDEKLDFALLMAYRSFRELHSRAKQWERTRASSPNMFPALYDSRRKSIVNQVRHQYVLLRAILKKAGELFEEYVDCEDAVDLWNTQRGFARGPLTPEKAEVFNLMFNDVDGNPMASGLISIYALQGVALKIQERYPKHPKDSVNFLKNGF